jgi:hypothetical protein
MRAVAVAALGKIVGHSLKDKLVVILWNHRAITSQSFRVFSLDARAAKSKIERFQYRPDSEERQIPHNI